MQRWHDPVGPLQASRSRRDILSWFSNSWVILVPPYLILPVVNYPVAVTDLYYAALRDASQHCRDHKHRWKMISTLTHSHHKQMKHVKKWKEWRRSPFHLGQERAVRHKEMKRLAWSLRMSCSKAKKSVSALLLCHSPEEIFMVSISWPRSCFFTWRPLQASHVVFGVDFQTK